MSKHLCSLDQSHTHVIKFLTKISNMSLVIGVFEHSEYRHLYRVRRPGAQSVFQFIHVFSEFEVRAHYRLHIFPILNYHLTILNFSTRATFTFCILHIGRATFIILLIMHTTKNLSNCSGC